MTTKSLTKENANGLLFFKEVAKYFMDFLETDFHKRKFPKRSVKFRNKDNLLIGLNLQKYETFNRLVLNFIAANFNEAKLNKIDKGVHKTTLPRNLLNLITLQIEKIDATQVDSIVSKIAEEIEKAGTLHEKEYDAALTAVVEAATKIIKADLVGPFIQSIEKPLQNLSLGDEDNVYLIEEELIAVFIGELESKISETLNRFITKEKVNLATELG
jgi:hypothetical protein